jgi:hypothetical protein
MGEVVATPPHVSMILPRGWRPAITTSCSFACEAPLQPIWLGLNNFHPIRNAFGLPRDLYQRSTDHSSGPVILSSAGSSSLHIRVSAAMRAEVESQSVRVMGC